MTQLSNSFLTQRRRGALIIAGALLILIGLLVSAAGLVLFLGGPEAGEGIVAGASATQGIAALLSIMGAVLIVAGIAALSRHRAAWVLGAAALVVFVAVGFVSNYVLYGSLRPTHTGTNVAVAALAIWLLSVGKPTLRSAS